MYTLRKILTSEVEFNYLLGKAYSVVLREKSEEQFMSLYSDFFKTSLVEGKEDNCYGFVSGEENSILIPLFKDQRSYIMTDSGKTLSNLTY